MFLQKKVGNRRNYFSFIIHIIDSRTVRPKCLMALQSMQRITSAVDTRGLPSLDKAHWVFFSITIKQFKLGG